MDVHVTTLSEDTANYGFLGEWGLSMLVEADGVKVLMDTGFSFSVVHNARVMGVDLATITHIVLSHGHADHTGGLQEVLKIKGEVEVIAHPDLWSAKHVQRDKETLEYNGIPFTREGLESLGAGFRLAREPVHITEHVMTSGEIPMVTDYEEIEKNLFVKEAGELYPDPMADDLALIVDTGFGLIVILGCAHRGIINTVRHAQNLTGRELVHAVIGGTHLYRASEERLERTVADLKAIGVQKLGVSHCTGFRASARLAQEFAGTFFLNHAGNRFVLP